MAARITRSSKNRIKHIVFDKNNKLQYAGICKLKINIVSKLLLVEPVDENYKMISALFKWKFLHLKNIIFVFGDHDFQDFALIFPTEEKANKVSIHVCKNEDVLAQELLFERFLIPMFDEISTSCDGTMIEIIVKWIGKLGKNLKENCLKVIKERGIYGLLFPQNTGRKRKYRDTVSNKSSNDDKHKKSRSRKRKHVETEYSIILDETTSRRVYFKYQVGFEHGLIVFTSLDKTQCHEYQWSFKKQCFFCLGCRNKGHRITAIITEEESIKLETKPHICSSKRYSSGNYNDIQIIKKPDYEILENLTSSSKKVLIVFNANNRSQCYEYYLSSKDYYLCRGCAFQGKHVKSQLCHENTEKEFIRLSNADHVCEYRKYDPKKFSESHQFLLKPNFEVQVEMKKGIERKTLIIFDGNDKILCHKYYYNTQHSYFFCNGCVRNQKNVSARLLVNDDGEEYVILSKTKHMCTLKAYIPPNENEIILHAPDIKYLDTTSKKFPKLFIFNANDRKLCYIFSHFYGDKIQNNHYRCLGCTQNCSKNKSTKHNRNEIVHAYLCQDSNGEYFVQMKNGQKHCCEPKKYEDYEVDIIKPEDYILYQEKGKKNINLAVYHPNDRNLCYRFYYSPTSNIFTCRPCSKNKNCITPRLHQDSNGNEFFTVKPIKHICKPIKVSSIKDSDATVIFLQHADGRWGRSLKRSGLTLEEKKKEVIDESRIVRKPNFELQESKDGIPDKKLIIYKSDDRNFCYVFTFMDRTKTFRCCKCRRIHASIRIDKETAEKYVVLPNSKGHSCEPIKYEPNKDIFKSSDFMLFNQSIDTKLWRLVIFTSPEKDLCYEYSYAKYNNTFRYRCLSCTILKKQVTGNLLKNGNGEEYVKLGQNDHTCTPKVFVPEDFQLQIIPESRFKLFCNKNGKKNAKLILFDAEKDGFIYTYYLQRDNYFICNNCMRKHDTCISAKLYEKENGEKFLELSTSQHKCQSIKFNHDEYESV